MASALRWKEADLWAKSSQKDLFLNGAVAGKVQSGGGLTWMQQLGRQLKERVMSYRLCAVILEYVIQFRNTRYVQEGKDRTGGRQRYEHV